MHAQCSLNRSQAAWLLSCERLFGTGKPVYFWTFTFVDVLDEWEYGKRFKLFFQALESVHGGRGCSGIRGLRVIEPHVNHGLHYHALLTKRLSVHIVRRVGARFGIGRVFVKRCNKGAALYLSKYLGKRKEFATRIRTWGAVGGFLACKVANVEKTSPYHTNMKRLYRGKKVGFAKATFVMDQSKRHGAFENWPPKAQSFAGESQSIWRGTGTIEASNASGRKIFSYHSRQTLTTEKTPF